MKRMPRPAALTLVLCLMLLSLPVFPGMQPAYTMAAATPPFILPPLDAAAAIMIDFDSRAPYFMQNADQPLAVASMSKMMTQYLILQAVAERAINWDQLVIIGPYPGYLGKNTGVSRIGLSTGQKKTVRDLFAAMTICSANDAAVALSEAVCGTEQAFVELMNRTAVRMGFATTRFVNCTGLPSHDLGPYRGNRVGQNIMTAREAALLARALAAEHPEVFDFTALPVTNVPGFATPLVNTNWMLPGHPRGRDAGLCYEGVDGLKTGFTNEAGYCFTATFQRKPFRAIVVIMGASSGVSRFQQTRSLLEQVWSNKLPTIPTSAETGSPAGSNSPSETGGAISPDETNGETDPAEPDGVDGTEEMN